MWARDLCTNGWCHDVYALPCNDIWVIDWWLSVRYLPSRFCREQQPHDGHGELRNHVHSGSSAASCAWHLHQLPSGKLFVGGIKQLQNLPSRTILPQRRELFVLLLRSRVRRPSCRERWLRSMPSGYIPRQLWWTYLHQVRHRTGCREPWIDVLQFVSSGDCFSGWVIESMCSLPCWNFQSRRHQCLHALSRRTEQL